MDEHYIFVPSLFITKSGLLSTAVKNGYVIVLFVCIMYLLFIQNKAKLRQYRFYCSNGKFRQFSCSFIHLESYLYR